ncbi:glyoxalase/bleomycin resistance/dioxygenase family protein [Pseudoalteromonas sp. NBT06-2]|uniref:VOC family protein n=1 Tax=Pseudoalteromonas sp. NBT06-2 TaxID=2025950 RepID=UPI000BA7CE6F|nr:VOC family protein [Pseudoalteromonas sp. NBT06-2]PAJ73620.1 glyoxalase/bleomycin resistance/dioxygenase family protein [Pseudoalteromonas sp. NBT06-2]
MAHLTHIALHVKDVDACVLFYKNYAGLKLVRDRHVHGKHIIWLAESGKESQFIFVLLPGGPGHQQSQNDFSHFGFALSSKENVDKVAIKAKEDGILLWPPKQEPFPVGYYCGVLDPDGNRVEFSYGQPLG